jgi:hypothetical protein
MGYEKRKEMGQKPEGKTTAKGEEKMASKSPKMSAAKKMMKKKK